MTQSLWARIKVGVNRTAHPLSPALPLEGDLSTHLTPGVEDGIKGSCMFAVDIFPNPFWIGLERLSGQSHPFRNAICREGFVNG